LISGGYQFGWAFDAFGVKLGKPYCRRQADLREKSTDYRGRRLHLLPLYQKVSKYQSIIWLWLIWQGGSTFYPSYPARYGRRLGVAPLS
jgi:hypothetical protein